MKRLKDNIIFVVIIVVILLGFFIISNEEYIRSNPFQKEFTIDTPLANYIADNGNNIIIDNGGHRLVVTDRSRKLLQTINGSYDEDNFSNATEVACDNEDNIYVIDKPVDELNQYAAGGRIICVGTTSCRTIESAAAPDGTLRPCSGWTEIFIYPGYQFKVLDCLITNFHLPESTLLMLVSALAGKEHIMAAYEEAVKERYRFFSFGDAMMIE